MTKKKLLSMLLAVVMALTSTATAFAATVPADVQPIKSYSATVGKVYRLPDDVKQAGDSYETSNAQVLTVEKDTGKFTPVASGVAYIVITNGTAKRYVKVTVRAATSDTGVFAGYNVTVLDKTTPAAKTNWDIKDTVYFESSTGVRLGSISLKTYSAIAAKHMAGRESSDVSVWFANEFNKYRGLGSNDNSNSSGEKVDTQNFRDEILRLSNKERANAGLAALVSDSDAMAYAQIRAKEIAVSYSHARPNGESKEYGSYTFVEVIFKGPTSPQDTISGWMASTGHKETILADYSSYGNKTGVGCYQDSSGTLYWVQVFVLWDSEA